MSTALSRPIALALFFSTVGMAGARAEPAPGEPMVLALIVTNNRSLQLGRPDLRYADDDGARYYEFFRMLAPPADVALLTELDADTARLFPHLGPLVQPPTRAALAAAADRLAERAATLRAAGRPVEFYFVFAGHGDIDRGRGFVELRDGAFTADDVERLLERIPSSHSHVILDSCNSFFVLNPRKPGGRRFATPADATLGLSRRIPRVGVLLSTSSEGEVFEWSELQSGIFSHAVRSGMAGAADVDGDGRVSYEELSAFVSTAAGSVRNPLYRPTVFARGPGGAQGTPLVDLRTARAASLALSGEAGRRLTLRDADDLPWVDLHREPEQTLVIRMPERLAAGLVVEERELRGETSVVVRRRRWPTSAASLEPSGPALDLSALALVTDAPRAGRGPQDLFRMLFLQPFGTHAFATWRSTLALTPPTVMGISRDDTERMRLLLKNTAELDHRRRVLEGVVLIGVAACLAGVGAFAVDQAGQIAGSATAYAGLGLLAVSAAPAAWGIARLVRSSTGERAYDEFARSLRRDEQSAAGQEMAESVARAEATVQSLARGERRGRIGLGVAGGALIAGGITGFIASFALNKDNAFHASTPFLFTALALSGAVVLADSFIETPIERMARLWAEDPGLARLPKLSLGVTRDGVVVAFRGEF